MRLDNHAVSADTHAIYRYNNVDPTQSTNLRRSFRNEIHRKLDEVIDDVQEWFDDENEDEFDTSRLRYRFEEWFEQKLFNEVLGSVRDSELHNGDHWTGSHVRTAYQHGLSMAKDDLQQFGKTEYERKKAVKFYSDAHKKAVEMEYEAAYMGLRDQMHRLVDDMGEVIRAGIDGGYSVDMFANEATALIDSQAKNHATAHANTIVVDAINEALLVSYEKAGITEVGVAPESHGDGTTQNAVAVPFTRIRQNVDDPETFAEAVGIDTDEAESLPDPDDPTTPDDVQWVTAGDSNVCTACASLEGTILAIEDVRGHEQFQPPIHPNCRCRLLPLA